MARYIDADKIKYTTDTHTVTDLKIAFKHEIDAIPTADVQEVTFCANCKFWNREHISCEGLARCNTGESGIRYRSRNDFCSRGAKMDKDEVQK